MTREFQTAREIYERRKDIERISSGCSKFDKNFSGGFESQATTEIYGEFGCGKTQICHTASVMAQMKKEEGGLEGSVIYIDTEGTFRPERIKEIAKARGVKNPDSVLDNIIHARAWSYAHQIFLITEGLEEQIRKLKNTERPVKLVVLDSLMALFRAELTGQGYLARRQQFVNRMYHLLGRLAETYNFVCIVTNQMVASTEMFGRDSASGGNVVAHTSTYRLSVRKTSKGIICRFVDSPMHPELEIVAKLGEKGFQDADDS
jgi:DNA repair protein RadA